MFLLSSYGLPVNLHGMQITLTCQPLVMPLFKLSHKPIDIPQKVGQTSRQQRNRDMAESWEDLGGRYLSGRGTYRFPIPNLKNIRCLSIYTQVVRPPQNEYLNRKVAPNRGFYGYLNFLKDDYVIKSYEVQYPLQRFDWYNDVTGVIQTMLPCINQEILQSIANLGLALGQIPVSIQNETQTWLIPHFTPDLLQFSFYSSTAMQISVKALKYDDCEELPDEPPREPPPPPPPRDRVPRDDPQEVDERYPEDDGDEYQRFPLDEPPPPEPPPRTCIRVKVRVRVFYSNNYDEATNVFCYGDVGDVKVAPGGISIALYCYGLYTGSGAQNLCTDEPEYATFQGTGGSYTILRGEIESVEPQ